jgi:hypothetical protein
MGRQRLPGVTDFSAESIRTILRGNTVIDECFVIGPIGDRLAPLGSEGRERYEDSIVVYESVIQAACSIVGLSPIRADEIAEPGEITESICLRLRDAPFVVADVTGANPNVNV